jgi:hypothetical protein
MAASKRAIPRGIDQAKVRKDILTDLVFCKMNTKSSTSTKAPAMTPIQDVETRVRLVCRGIAVVVAADPIGSDPSSRSELLGATTSVTVTPPRVQDRPRLAHG